MPKNIKKAKKIKKFEDDTRELVFKEDQQDYAKVISLLGNCQVKLVLLSTNEEKIGIIRGFFVKRKIFINKDDYVLVSLRDYELKKVDIVHKYTNDEARNLKNLNEINEGGGGEGKECECGELFENDIKFEIDDI
jgi:translation initiation factor 1A